MITTSYLASLQGCTERAIQQRAKKEGWPYQTTPGRGQAGRKREYIIESLPLDVQAKVFLGWQSECEPPSDLDLGKAKTSLDLWGRANEPAKAKALARREILQALETFISGRKRTDAAEKFVSQYSRRDLFLGISEGTYQAFSSISLASLNRWRLHYKSLGLPGLLDKRERGRPKPKLSIMEVEYILGLLMQSPHRRDAWICKYYQNKYGRVSDKTVTRVIKKWKKENAELWTLIKNPDAWRNKYQAAPGDASLKARYFLHLIEFDSTPADIMCTDRKRYTLMAAIDIFSRKAMCLVVPTGTAIGLLNLIRNIITEWGFFDVMIHDNGKEFCANDIQVTCQLLKIKDLPLPPFTPWLKPFVERFFGTLSIFLEELLGFIGHNVAQRREIESRKSFAERMFDKNEVIECGLTRDQLQENINRWVEDVYHQDRHSSLGMCPEAKAAQTSKSVRKAENTEALKVLLAPCGTRLVQKKGVFFDGGIYWAKELALHIGEQIQIRRDFGSVGLIYVFDPKMKFICIAKDSELEEITLEEAKTARKLQKKQLREQAGAIKALTRKAGDPMGQLLEMKRKKPGRIRALYEEEIFENSALREAEKAVKMRTEQEIDERERVATGGGRISNARLWHALGQKQTETPERKYRLIKD